LNRDITIPAPLPRLSETPGEVRNLGPTLGNFNKQIYTEELNLSDREVANLKKRGVI